jgi:hypothetical protein
VTRSNTAKCRFVYRVVSLLKFWHILRVELSTNSSLTRFRFKWLWLTNSPLTYFNWILFTIGDSYVLLYSYIEDSGKSKYSGKSRPRHLFCMDKISLLKFCVKKKGKVVSPMRSTFVVLYLIEEFYPLRYSVIWSVENQLVFRENMSPPPSAWYLLYVGFLLGLFFDYEDGGQMFLPNTAWLSTDYTALYCRS